jgi:bacterioferritin-associated ferredoxin
MYICTCNTLTECAVSTAVRDGAASATQIFAKLDCAPQCGKCLPVLRERVRSASPGMAGRPVIAAE